MSPDEDWPAGIAVHDSGGNGPAVVWVHPYTLDGSVWRRLWDRLPGWRHVAPDLPGHGRSRPLRPGERLADLADVVTDVATRSSARRVVGLSFGSTVALQAVISSPRRFQTLVLAAPAVAGWPRDPASGVRYAQLRWLFTAYGRGPHLTTLWMSSPPDIFRGAKSRQELWTELRGLVERHPWDELADNSMAGLLAADQTDDQLSFLDAETLVVVGEHDMPTFRATADRLEQLLPGCQLLEVAEAGHLPLLERPDAVAPAIDRHLHGRT